MVAVISVHWEARVLPSDGRDCGNHLDVLSYLFVNRLLPFNDANCAYESAMRGVLGPMEENS